MRYLVGGVRALRTGSPALAVSSERYGQLIPESDKRNIPELAQALLAGPVSADQQNADGGSEQETHCLAIAVDEMSHSTN